MIGSTGGPSVLRKLGNKTNELFDNTTEKQEAMHVTEEDQRLPRALEPRAPPAESLTARTVRAFIEEGDMASARDWLQCVTTAANLATKPRRWPTEEWRRLLGEGAEPYPYADQVIAQLEAGFNIDPADEEPAGPRRARNNHGSAYLFEREVEQLLEKELGKDNIARWPEGTNPPWYILPLAVKATFSTYGDEQQFDEITRRLNETLRRCATTDMEGTARGEKRSLPPITPHRPLPNLDGIRLIFDGRELGERGKPRKFDTQTLDEFLNDMPDGAYFWKADIRGAFRNGAVLTDNRPLLGIAFRGKTYVYINLPFGANLSPVEYTTVFGRPIIYVLTSQLNARGIPGYVMVYVDDFIGRARRLHDAQHQLERLKDITKKLGVELADEKEVPPTQGPQPVLGYLLTTTPTVQLAASEQKIAKLRAILEAVQSREGPVPRRLYEKLMGVTSHLARAIPGLRTHMADLMAAAKAAKGESVHLTANVRHDLNFIAREAADWNGMEQPHRGPPTIPVGQHLTSDAAGGEGGIAIALFGEVLACEYPGPLEDPIQDRELLALVLLAIAAGERLGQPKRERTAGLAGRATRVTLRCDNTNAGAWVKKQRSTTESRNRLLTLLHRVSTLRRVQFDISWISTEENGLSDAGSRHNNRQLAQEVLAYNTHLPTSRPTWWPARTPFPARPGRVDQDCGHHKFAAAARSVLSWDPRTPDGGVGEVEKLLDGSAMWTSDLQPA